MITAVLFGSFLVLLILGVPVAVALGCGAVSALLVDGTIPLVVVGQRIFAANDSFTLLAVPFFMLAGSIMTKGGISRRLVDFAQAFIGSVHGGLGFVATIASMFFAAISGSSSATAAAVGGTLIPAMKEKGYDEDFSAAVIAASGTTGLVIPPSTAMCLYGVATGTSIGALFVGGFIPGILMGIACMIVIYVTAKKRGYGGEAKSTGKEKLAAFKDAIWAILMPVIVLGGIYAGIFTPTESAVVACVYGLFVSMVIYKDVTWKDIIPIAMDAVKGTAVALFIVSTAGIFGWFLVAYQIPQVIAAAMATITSSKIVLLILINLFLIFVGTFLSCSAAVTLLSPILYPVAVAFGIDPVAFGVIMTVNLSIGCITPPVGVNLYVTQSISEVSFEKITKATLPFLGALFIVLFLISFFPSIITFLPNLMK